MSSGSGTGTSDSVRGVEPNWLGLPFSSVSRLRRVVLASVRGCWAMDSAPVDRDHVSIVEVGGCHLSQDGPHCQSRTARSSRKSRNAPLTCSDMSRSEEHTSELQSRGHLVCRLLLEKKKRHNR